MPVRVLVVDDDADIRFIAGKILETAEITTEEASNLDEMFERLEKSPSVDVILLDLTMPGPSGWTALPKLQSRPAWAKIPVIILTGHDDPQFKEAAKRRGVAGYVTKPFRDWELIDAVKKSASRKLRRDPWAQ